MKYSKDTAALADHFNKVFVSTGANSAHASSELAKAHGFHCNLWEWGGGWKARK